MPILNCSVRAHAISTPAQVAIYLPETKISYAQLDGMISQRTDELQHQGVTKKESVAFCADNCLSLVISLFATIRLGAIFCPLSHMYTDTEKKALILQAGIKYLWQEEGVISYNSHIKTICCRKSSDKLVNLDSLKSTSLNNIALDGALPSTIIFTSGSTGQPKAAVHSLNNHYYSALGAQTMVPLKQKDCWLASLPFNHIGGLAIIMRCFFAGASIALVDRKNLLRSFLQYPITHASLVPTQLYRLLEQYQQLSQNNILVGKTGYGKTPGKPKSANTNIKLKYLLLGGAPIPPMLLAQTSTLGVSVFHSYGLTEMSSQVATSKAETPYFSSLLPYRQWKLVKGEIVLSGETLFLGYMVKGKLQSPFIDGWFYSKDLAEKTSQGVKIIGRKDNMFIVGGENYQPEAIEKIIMTCNLVNNALIVPVNNEELGSIPVVFIDWKSSPDLLTLKEYLCDKIARIKIPKHFIDWPSNIETSLKINRKILALEAKNIMSLQSE